jgi:hypothetical protein
MEEEKNVVGDRIVTKALVEQNMERVSTKEIDADRVEVCNFLDHLGMMIMFACVLSSVTHDAKYIGGASPTVHSSRKSNCIMLRLVPMSGDTAHTVASINKGASGITHG